MACGALLDTSEGGELLCCSREQQNLLPTTMPPAGVLIMSSQHVCVVCPPLAQARRSRGGGKRCRVEEPDLEDEAYLLASAHTELGKVCVCVCVYLVPACAPPLLCAPSA